MAAGGLASAQTAARGAAPIRPDWRRIGNSAVDLGLASPASGPVDRVWFSPDGGSLFVRTRSGLVFETTDRENWVLNPTASAPAESEAAGVPLPEAGSKIRAQGLNPNRLYAMGHHIYRSDDSGVSWANLTAYRRESIIGGGMKDLAVSRRDPDELVAANEHGVWRSADGGLSWSGLNESLPNLAVRRLLATPQGSRGIRVLLDGAGAAEWVPGEKQAWRPVPDAALEQETALRRLLSAALGVEISAVATTGDFIYAGSADGRLWASPDRGRSWNAPGPEQAAGAGPIESIFVDPQAPRTALAALGGSRAPHVRRTTNGGLFWDDLTSDLPEAPAFGITADRASGAVYVATGRGVFFTRAELNAPGQATRWSRLENLPQAAAMDVKLDAEGNQLFAALQGHGVYAAMAPHRLGAFRLVNAADFSQRAAAPGALLSVLGGRVQAARAGDLSVPVLAASDTESQIQVPFEVRGASLSLALAAGQGSVTLGVPLENVSPAIFIDRDGTPLLLNADSGTLLDAMNPARSGGRLQILAAGMGRVRPAWPTGLAAPVENPPQVVAPVRVYLDRVPVEVTRATLAPGYIGFYLIEVQLPEIVNAGPAELYLESDGKQSNRVRVWLEQ